jgi:hypothetical protein
MIEMSCIAVFSRVAEIGRSSSASDTCRLSCISGVWRAMAEQLVASSVDLSDMEFANTFETMFHGNSEDECDQCTDQQSQEDRDFHNFNDFVEILKIIK